jgi:hypothetical protein
VAMRVRRMSVGFAESPAHIEDRDRIAGTDKAGQLRGGDQYLAASAQGLKPKSCKASVQPASQSAMFAGVGPPPTSAWHAKPVL